MTQEKQPKAPKATPDHLDPNSELPPDADLEERFNDFWKKNGGSIFVAIGVGALGVLGMQTYQYVGDRNETATREAYRVTVTPEEKLAFAEANSDHQLAGLARLEAADAAFEAKDYARAESLYAGSTSTLEGTPLVHRAQLGRGMSLLLAGQADAGQTVLQSLAQTGTALDQIRAEAAYQLAVSRWESGDFEGVQEALDLISSLENPGFWTFRANELTSQIPELAALEQ